LPSILILVIISNQYGHYRSTWFYHRILQKMNKLVLRNYKHFEPKLYLNAHRLVPLFT